MSLVSIIIPVYNEEAVLRILFDRLYPALDALNVAYEVLFINDGSYDRSGGLLSEQYEKRKDVTRVIFLDGNFGQHRAILAGFAHCRGERIVTLDADLQNPPEEIGLLLAEMDKGHDYVGSIRKQRKDHLWRRFASCLMNRLREKITQVKMTDQGCMMRAYNRRIVNMINQCQEMHTFIPALAYSFSQDPTEIVIGHAERFAGESKYGLYSLIRLNFDLMTGFSLVPLQVFSMIGMLVSSLAGLLVVYLVARRLIVGPEAEGLFTLQAIQMFLIGLTLFGIGILGEYIGRIYQEVRQRPRYLISGILQAENSKDEPQQGQQPSIS